MTDRERQLRHLEMFMKQCEMWANWHIASATTGHCKSREVHNFATGKLTPEQLVEDTLTTAKQHIHNYQEAVEKYIGLLNS